MDWYGYSVLTKDKKREKKDSKQEWTERKGTTRRGTHKEYCEIQNGGLKLSEGLTAEEKVICTETGSSETGKIIVPLVKVTVWKTEGATVAPVNKDLPCLLNDEALVSEANLLPGSVIEVGDKQLEFSDGPLARPRRRCLPPTPGVHISPQPPPKPKRGSIISDDDSGPVVTRNRPLSKKKPPPVPTDCAVIQLPNTDAELLKQTRKPEQLASMASSYVTKHIHLHTDARVDTELTNQIFSAMLEVANHGRSILLRFLTDLIEEQANGSQTDDQPPEPSHGAVIILLREILRQFLDPQNLVVVTLKMLRALSHVPGATKHLVECEVTSAVLGTMAALKLASEVQQYCLDVLAKIALFHPTVIQKAPLRESATDLIVLAMEAHPSSVNIAQAACRALANLATTLYTVVSNKIDNDHAVSEELQMFVKGLISVLEYMFIKSLPAVQDVLKCHCHDLTVKTESRRFIFIYAKQEQLKQRKDLWLTSPSPQEPPPPLPSRPHHHQHTESDDDDPNSPGTGGIMKRSRSFENLRTPERKVTFGEDSAPEFCTPSSSPSPTPPQDVTEDEENPIQILAQRVIPVPTLTDSSPDTPTASKTVIGHQAGDDHAHSKAIGQRPAAEGSDFPFTENTEYENWDLLRGVLRRKSTLKGHKYSAEDIKFMTRITKTQVVALVCALAVGGDIRGALSLIDRPLRKIVLNTEVPPGVCDFVEREYSTTDTLVEVDPGLMVSLIDAVRYLSRSYEMAQRCVLESLKALDSDQQSQIVAVTVEFLAATITNRALTPAMTVPSFVDEVLRELERAKEVSQNAPALKSLFAEIKQCAKKTHM